MVKRYKLIKIDKISYSDALALQNILRNKVLNDDSEQYILALEHNNVITSGKRGFKDNLKYNYDFYYKRNIELIKTDRGGLTTFHGEGQLVFYFILNLNDLKTGIKKFVNVLETTVINILKNYDIKARKIENMRGVFVGDDKIAAIGLSVKHNVTMHGLALNITTDLKNFDLFVPCGLKDKGVTSIFKEKNIKVNNNEIINFFMEEFSKNIGVYIER